MKNKSVVNEAREIQIAVDLIQLGASAAVAMEVIDGVMVAG